MEKKFDLNRYVVFRAVFAIYEYNNNDKTFIITPANKVLVGVYRK